MNYNPDNIFRRIIDREEEASFVYESENAVAFLDLFPVSLGHTLVVSKYPAVSILDITPEKFRELTSHVRKVAHLLHTALSPDGIELLQFNGAAAGQSVFHLHFHLVPRWVDRSVWQHGTALQADRRALDVLAEKIRGYGDGCDDR